MFLFDKKTPTTQGSGGSISGATTFMWDDAAKGENVMYRIPRNIIWNDNVVVREDEYAVFFRDGKVEAEKPDMLKNITYSLGLSSPRTIGIPFYKIGGSLTDGILGITIS